MSMNYSEYVSGLANMLVIPADDANFLAAVPRIIDDAEQRIYRELDLLSTVVRDSGGVLTANSRNFTLPQTYGRFVVTESMNVFSPAGTLTNRYQMVPVSKEFIDAIWPNESSGVSPSIPTYYAPVSDQNFIVGPPPDEGYSIEVIGTIRPNPLSVSNTTTYLTLYLPDLFMAESLVFGYGYLKDFGAMADDPRGSTSWEGHYGALWQSANVEETRKRYASFGWTSKQPTPIAASARG